MHLTTEIEDHRQRALIAGSGHKEFLNILKAKLIAHDVDVYTATEIPEAFLSYDIIIFLNDPRVMLPTLLDYPDKKFIFIFFNQHELALTYSSFSYENNSKHIKVISLESTPTHFAKDVETLLWFSFARTEDAFLHLYHPDLRSPVKKKKSSRKSLIDMRDWFTRPRNMVLLGILLFIVSMLLFLPPLGAASYYHYRAAQAVRTSEDTTVESKRQQASSYLRLSKSFYTFSRPIFNFFSIARPIDSMFQINESTQIMLGSYSSIKARSGSMLERMMSPSIGDDQTLIEDKEEIMKSLHEFDDQLAIVKETFPTWNADMKKTKTELNEVSNLLDSVFELEPHMDTLFGRDAEKKYMLLFANNMELRPGGGFIGSFAIMRMKNYHLEELTVYDVYDADGQLEERIQPPAAISEHLDQPFWFLRDSAFSPDYPTNYAQAERFLELELGEVNFDGGVMMTTTAVQNILQAMDKLYIADYDDTITAENFYLKTQIHAEKDFFPGSQQKKRFLASVMDTMLLNIGQASPTQLVRMLQRSLDEKQLVMYTKDAEVQQVIERNFWAGQLLKPTCQLESAVNCVLDFIYPIDANLGVNKANYFVQRPLGLEVNIQPDGSIQNKLSLAYQNTSYADVFPGGTYKNYFQLYLPPNAQITTVSVDDEIITDYEETNFDFKTISMLVDIPPQQSKTIQVQYVLPTTIISGSGIYQLIFQKQVGSPSSDFFLKVTAPSNVQIVNNNFSPLVNSSGINYNTTISSDKIFVIEFSKK
ncbi:MAG: DUF4012 domain-containing protein [Weeksellaceae bacterium]